MKNISDVKIGNNIALLENKLNLSDTELAKIIGIARPHLTNIKNQKTIPTLTIAFKIAFALDTPINQVFYPVKISQN